MTDPNFQGKQDALSNELLNSGVVESTAFSDNPLTIAWSNLSGVEWNGKDPNVKSDFTICYVSDTYGTTVKWQIADGRDFNETIASDSAAVVVNESAVRYMNLKNPVGEYIRDERGRSMKIIGVVKDLIMQSPYEPARQTIFMWNKYVYTNIIIRVKPDRAPNESIAEIEDVFKRIIPTAAFDYSFVDEDYAKKFSQEERIGKLSRVFALLAILVSSLGLFGLASFVAEQRTKEIGIRKLLGASVAGLWRMLSRDFVVLVLISCFVAIPIAWYFMNSWLQKFPYHTEISWWLFVMTGIGALVITLLTVSFHAIKAALMNPVNSLKSE
jgi:ABC-type antimicrobial peptide transport system permease subunit